MKLNSFLFAVFHIFATLSGVAILTCDQAYGQSGINGLWTFTVQSAYGYQIVGSGQLTQVGNNFSGQLNFSGSPCATLAALSGTISGTAMSMMLNENGQFVELTGTLSPDDNSASGTYVTPKGGCTNGDFGIWSGKRSNPVSLTSLTPSSATAGSSAFTLTVFGSNLLSGAAVYWNGSSLKTTFVSATQVSALVPASLIANAGSVSVIMVNPGGAVSNLATFIIAPQGLNFTSALRVAHIADGAGWTTTFAIENLDVVPINYAFNFWSDNGSALPIQLLNANGSQAATSGTLDVGATYFAQSPGISPTLLQGWAEAASSGKIGVMALFKYSAPGVPDSQGSVIGTTSASTISMPYDSTQGYIMGVALSNTNPTQPLTIALSFKTDQGVQSSAQMTLPAHGHTAFVMANSFPATSGTRGAIHFTTTSPDLTVLGERFTPSLTFTTMGTFQ